MHPATVSIALFVLSVVCIANGAPGPGIGLWGVIWIYLVHHVCKWWRAS